MSRDVPYLALLTAVSTDSAMRLGCVSAMGSQVTDKRIGVVLIVRRPIVLGIAPTTASVTKQ